MSDWVSYYKNEEEEGEEEQDEEKETIGKNLPKGLQMQIFVTFKNYVLVILLEQISIKSKIQVTIEDLWLISHFL